MGCGVGEESTFASPVGQRSLSLSLVARGARARLKAEQTVARGARAGNVSVSRREPAGPINLIIPQSAARARACLGVYASVCLCVYIYRGVYWKRV